MFLQERPRIFQQHLPPLLHISPQKIFQSEGGGGTTFFFASNFLGGGVATTFFNIEGQHEALLM
jgi:hypothetical protein